MIGYSNQKFAMDQDATWEVKEEETYRVGGDMYRHKGRCIEQKGVVDVNRKHGNQTKNANNSSERHDPCCNDIQNSMCCDLGETHTQCIQTLTPR